MKRGSQELSIPRQLKGLWLSRAMQDITQRVKEGQSTFTIIENGSTQFQLPDDFSALLSAGIGTTIFDIVDVADIPNYSAGTISRVAIFSDGISWYVRFDGEPTGGEVIRYYTTVALYSPAGSKQQGIGFFDTLNFSGDFQLRDSYFSAALEYMLGQLFDDRLARYENEVQKMRQNSSTTTSQLTYNFGGVSI